MTDKDEWNLLFSQLSEDDRKKLFNEARRRSNPGYIRPLRFPILFAVRVGLMTFLLLMLMPTHPIAMPAAFGGALSINLLIHWREI